MNDKEKSPPKMRQHAFLLFISSILILSMVVGCAPSVDELEAVDYTPLPGDDWQVSTPAEQGLDPMLIAELYHNAAELETLYGLLVIKNGNLIAETYFNEGSVEQNTIRDLLQMRAGYPYDSTGHYSDVLYLSGDWRWLPHLVDFPLVSDPGTEVNYSSVTSHLLGVIVARACDTDLMSFAQDHLFTPIDAELGDWTRDLDGYNWGWGEIYVTARDMARFGLLYLNDGEYEGNQVISADWVHDSLQTYSEDAWITKSIGRYFGDTGYGYQWWSARAGDHRFNFAWGHGGQLIVLLDELDMIVVTTADPLHELPPEEGWKHEKAVIDLVGEFINSLPSE